MSSDSFKIAPINERERKLFDQGVFLIPAKLCIFDVALGVDEIQRWNI